MNIQLVETKSGYDLPESQMKNLPSSRNERIYGSVIAHEIAISFTYCIAFFTAAFATFFFRGQYVFICSIVFSAASLAFLYLHLIRKGTAELVASEIYQYDLDLPDMSEAAELVQESPLTQRYYTLVSEQKTLLIGSLSL